MKCIEPGCNEEGNHKIRTIDGETIRVCDEHLEGWTHCKEIQPWLRRRKVLTVDLAVILVILFYQCVVQVKQYFQQWDMLPAHILITPSHARTSFKVGS